ncbi:predicted protein [Histoplasma capsulatum G186AR]|uniref:Uncharacterized protein n=1 Tax=Ajellomyces capsulatus (strain G186AR / H82 / ATCC MYA-2454 / RMSCC 2432) TaxID=447093 RepID=C0NXL3_AJECG|nr:uncharacterized protein HCBG_08205 [Histoplasma capsulatum G186AR]EEH04079.1 predicted protein [Histoplasma capsulatum G186AR]
MNVEFSIFTGTWLELRVDGGGSEDIKSNLLEESQPGPAEHPGERSIENAMCNVVILWPTGFGTEDHFDFLRAVLNEPNREDEDEETLVPGSSGKGKRLTERKSASMNALIFAKYPRIMGLHDGLTQQTNQPLCYPDSPPKGKKIWTAESGDYKLPCIAIPAFSKGKGKGRSMAM